MEQQKLDLLIWEKVYDVWLTIYSDKIKHAEFRKYELHFILV